MEKDMISTYRQHDGSYITLTWPMYKVEKNLYGWWYRKLSPDAPKIGPFIQKKQALEHLENIDAPRLSVEGQQRVKSAKRIENCDSILLSTTGYDKAYWEAYIDRTARMVWSWCIIEYGLNSRLALNFKVEQTYSDSNRIRNSYANSYRIKIRPVYYAKIKKNDLFFFNEYRHIEKDPDIGEFHTDDFHKLIDGVILHEIAHVVQLNKKIYEGFTKAYSASGVCQGQWHGKDWQTIYHRLRVQFLPCSTDMGNEFPRVIL
jgi:hypothetical protein